MSSYMNLDQPTANFWDNYLVDSGDSTAQELSAANLQSFASNLNVDDSNFMNPPVGHNDPNFQPMVLNGGSYNDSSSNIPSDSVSHSPGSSNNNFSSSLNRLNNNIHQTQNEISSIKQELSYDSDLLPNVANNSSQSNTSADIIERNSSSSSGNGKKGQQSVVDKRKSQNRAAQRAFRERKEQKLKELENKLQQSEDEKQSILQELEKMKLKNIIITTENQMLLKNTATMKNTLKENEQRQQQQENGGVPLTPNSFNDNGNFDDPQQRSTLRYIEQKFTFPSAEENQLLPQSTAMPNEEEIARHVATSTNQSLVYKNPESTCDKLLSTAAVWDYLAKFEEVNENCDLDVDAIMKSLEGSEKCYGLGPGFSLASIKNAILQQVNHE